MKTGFTRVAFLLDRSGSMEPRREAAVEAVNSFVREQRTEPGTLKMKLVLFDTQYEVAFDKDLREVDTYTQADYRPRGGTALFDAECRIIDELGRELKAMPESERPEKVIVVTMTDGEENASKRTQEDVISRIKTQQDKYNWAFIYLGANQDAVTVGKGMGMHAGATMSYSANPIAMRNTMMAANSYVRGVRGLVGGQSVNSVAFTDEDRLKAMANDETQQTTTS